VIDLISGLAARPALSAVPFDHALSDRIRHLTRLSVVSTAEDVSAFDLNCLSNVRFPESAVSDALTVVPNELGFVPTKLGAEENSVVHGRVAVRARERESDERRSSWIDGDCCRAPLTSAHRFTVSVALGRPSEQPGRYPSLVSTTSGPSPVDPKLIDAFRAFTGEILIRLREAVATSGVEQRLRRWVVFEGESFRDDGEFKPHYWPLLESLLNAEIWKDSVIALRVKTLFDAGLLYTPTVNENGKPKVNPTFDEMMPDLVRYLLSPVVTLIDRVDSLDPPEQSIREAAIELVRLRTEPQPWALAIPLINLSSEIVPLTFGRLTLAPLNDQEKGRLWGTGSIHVEMIRFLDLLHATLKLGYSGMHQKVLRETLGQFAVGPLEHELTVEAGHVVTAFRLQKCGEVGAPIYVHLERDIPAGMGNQIRYQTSDNLLPERLELLAADVSKVEETFTALRAAHANGKLGSLEVALRRFNLSYARREADDKVIDFAIAFEATVLHGLKEELRYRLALRTAALLRADHESVSTCAFMKQFYDIRSLVVHEGVSLHQAVIKKAKMPVAEFVGRSADLLRATLREYVRAAASGKSIKEVGDGLDVLIAASLKPEVASDGAS
jgi:hypothetical protein